MMNPQHTISDVMVALRPAASTALLAAGSAGFT